MKLIADSLDGLRQMIQLLDVPVGKVANSDMSHKEYQKWLEDYGISTRIAIIKQYRGV